MNKTKSIDDVYDDNAEASRKHNIRPKGSKPAAAGKVQVTHKRSVGLSLLVKYQLMVMTANLIAGLVFISQYVDEPTYKAHFMWAYGIANLLAMVPSFIRKLE